MTESEFETLFNLKYNSFCNYALAIIKDEAAAEDIVQEIFIDFWKRHAAKEIIFKVDNYLIRAVKFKCIDHLRKINRNRIYQEEIKNIKEDPGGGDNEKEEVNLQEIIDLAIDQLPPKTKEVFILSKIKKLTYREIAGKLNISEKTVENQMTRAFKHLREKLKDFRFFSIILFYLFK